MIARIESNVMSSIAGSDTTSTALAATFFYLAHHVRVYERVTEEVHHMFSVIDDICSGPILNSCIYLRACIDEAMRLSPSVGGILPREVLTGRYDVEGHHLPQGTVIGTPHYTLHHNAEYYPDPFSYRPERWIVDPSTGVTD